MKNEKNSLVIFLVLSVFLGLISGAISSFIIRSYVLGDIFTLPYSGEMNLLNGSYRGSGLVISGAKKVVVEQNDKIASTIDDSKSGLVGIFKKKPSIASTASKINIAGYYEIGSEVAQGLIITSDGWILSPFKPDSLNYVVITNDKRVFVLDKIIGDTSAPFYFLHVAASDLPVKKFVDMGGLKNGELLLAIDWSGRLETTYVSDMNNIGSSYVNSSDSFYKQIDLSSGLSNDFRGVALFNLSGDVVGLLKNKEKAEPVIHFESAIKSLLRTGDIQRPSLGLSYIDLSRLIGIPQNVSGQGKYSYGAMVYSDSGLAVQKGSAADLAGVKDGDVIVAVDNVEINQNTSLSEAIQKFSKGDTITLVILRDSEKKEIEVELK